MYATWILALPLSLTGPPPPVPPGVGPVAVSAVQRGARAGTRRGAQREGTPRGGLLGPVRGAPPAESGRPGAGRQEAPRRVEVSGQAANEAQIRTWFDDGDWDDNGWISFREAKKSLSFDRERYGAYDADDDGRLTLPEFREYYFYNFRNVGGFRPPKQKPETHRPPRRSSEQLRNAYDRNLDSQISLRELKQILDDYQRTTGPNSEQVLRALDADRDHMLDLNELRGLQAILHPLQLQANEESDGGTSEVNLVGASVRDLFGQRIPRGGETGTPFPPLIVGPIPHHDRLDYDGNGIVTVEDLEGLLRPVQISLRIQTVFSTLDLDGDGTLDATEFRRALVDIE